VTDTSASGVLTAMPESANEEDFPEDGPAARSELQLRLELVADRNSPRQARKHAEAIGASCGVDTDAVALCVSEAVTNVVFHAYRDQLAPGAVEVVLRPLPAGAGLEIDVIDRGQGLAPRIDSPGAGLGLPIIQALADSLIIRSDHGGTRLRMTFRPIADDGP